MREPAKKEIMDMAFRVFNSVKYGTTATVEKNVLIIRWKTDPGEIEKGMIPGCVLDYRYVVAITGNDTWAGYDTDRKLNSIVKAYDEDFPKDYKPEQIHRWVAEFFRRLGFTKDEQFNWRLLDKDYRSGCIASGITGLSVLGIMGNVLLYYGAGLAGICLALFLPVAACLILILSGLIRMPGESVRRMAGAMMMLSGFIYIMFLGLIWLGILD